MTIKPIILPTREIPLNQKLGMLVELRELALLTEEGSDIQVNAENLYWQCSETWFKIDWESHWYLLKATCEERFEYADDIIRDILKEQGYEI